MTDEEDAGAAYLAALRQSSGRQSSGAAAARAPEIPAPVGPKIQNSIPLKDLNVPAHEKRKSPRYKCTGSVRLETSGGSASWATFTDISLHGCYVESAVPYPKGTVIGLKLEANDFRFEATGEVRALYPGLGMGISFTTLSDTDRGRLRELVSSISSHSVILGSRPAPQPLSIGPADIPPVSNPSAVLQAMTKFFGSRHMMGREEFLKILRKNQ